MKIAVMRLRLILLSAYAINQPHPLFIVLAGELGASINAADPQRLHDDGNVSTYHRLEPDPLS
ncbi:MAG TPA: hypothetical protein VFZ91_07290 [Allosphingosinicella sp.]